jgi:acylphosphatase
MASLRRRIAELEAQLLLLREADMSESMVCQNIRVSGVVQGVGFRPFVWRLARELGLAGWVRNDSRGVEIEVAVRPPGQNLIERLEQDAPPLARVNSVVARDAAPAATMARRLRDHRQPQWPGGDDDRARYGRLP